MPFPEPLVGIATAIHGALLAAVHAQSAAVEMLTVCGPPAAGAVSVSGATVALQPLSCETVNVWPAAVIVPLRAPPEFGAAANCTDPGPFPLAPDVTLIHPAFATAVHAHDAFVLTLNDAPPPAAGIAGELVGAMEYVHPALWVTVNVCPPAVSVPVRCGPVLAAAV